LHWWAGSCWSASHPPQEVTMMMRGIMTLMLFGLLSLAVAGCGGEGGNDEAASSEAAAAATERYTVLGTVSKLPDVSGDTNLYLRHAAIPDYKNEAGEAVGMKAMTMPFPLADGVSIEGLQEGDPVEFTFTMRWKPTGHYEIVKIVELPAGTEIDFDGAGSDSAQDEHPH
jgi:Cu/Ag efflux protein CusF